MHMTESGPMRIGPRAFPSTTGIEAIFFVELMSLYNNKPRAMAAILPQVKGSLLENDFNTGKKMEMNKEEHKVLNSIG